jgi:integrase
VQDKVQDTLPGTNRTQGAAKLIKGELSMAREIDRLNPLRVKNEQRPGRHADGNGLYLEIDGTGGKSWIFMWKRDGKRRAMGLGSARTISLAKARDLAKQAAEIVAEGNDPIDERKVEREKARVRAVTFTEAAIECHADIGSAWRTAKHRAHWLGMLKRDAGQLANKAVSEIGVDDVVRVLKPLWVKQPDLAMRLRIRIEKVFDWPKANKYRQGDNPAAWKGNLKFLMPPLPPARTRVQHLAAVPYEEMPAFMVALRALSGRCARALEFTILTAVRTGETFGATWDEINIKNRLWTIPGPRMKSGAPHLVPLSDRVLQIVEGQLGERQSRYVFPGFKDDRPLSTKAMLDVLEELGVDATVHGFRSTFRDWAGDLMATRFPRDVVELALAHTVGTATERAYRRGTALKERAELMNAWAAYCERPPQADNVISIERKPIPA